MKYRQPREAHQVAKLRDIGWTLAQIVEVFEPGVLKRCCSGVEQLSAGERAIARQQEQDAFWASGNAGLSPSERAIWRQQEAAERCL